MKKFKLSFIFIGILIICLTTLVFFLTNPFSNSEVKKISVGVNPVKGNPETNITIIEFSDFQCPACNKAQPIINAILEKYDGKISFYYRNFPLSSIHPNALLAAKAAEAANEQGKFWEYHDLLFANQNNLDETSLQKYAQQIGLNITKFNLDLKSKKIKDIVKQDIKDAKNLNVQGTPTFFINGQLVLGADAEKIQRIIEGELKQ